MNKPTCDLHSTFRGMPNDHFHFSLRSIVDTSNSYRPKNNRDDELTFTEAAAAAYLRPHMHDLGLEASGSGSGRKEGRRVCYLRNLKRHIKRTHHQ